MTLIVGNDDIHKKYPFQHVTHSVYTCLWYNTIRPFVQKFIFDYIFHIIQYLSLFFINQYINYIHMVRKRQLRNFKHIKNCNLLKNFIRDIVPCLSLKLYHLVSY